MAKKEKRPLLEVRWADVSSFSGWESTDVTVKNCKPFSAVMVGWEITRTKNYIVLATAFSGKECNGRRAIPLGCIKKIRRID